MLLTLSNDVPHGSSNSHFEKFAAQRVLEGLKKLDAQARQQGLDAIDASDPLVRIGMETDSEGRVTRNGYGVFDLSWQAEKHPEWARHLA